jgi:hemoglobin/transferrin/lactoferrin receptor protein
VTHRSFLPGRARIARGVRLALLLALAVALPGAARAQEAKRSSAFADTSRPVLFLQETVVTGARYSRQYYESPQALSFMPRSVIREQQPIVLGDVLATLPGVASNQDSPWEQRPSIRGLTNQRVLVLVDGSPMNSVRGNGPHTSLVDPAQVERIEVVRGPSSVAYGSDALGGVINIITRAPEAGGRALRGTATGGASVEGMPERHGALSLNGHAGRLSAFVGGGARKADDYRNPDGTVPHSGLSAWNGLANLRCDLTDRLALKGGYQLYRGQDIGVPGLDTYAPGATWLFGFPHYNRDFAHLALEHQYPGHWLASTRVNTYWQRERRNFYSDQWLEGDMISAFGVPPRALATQVATRQDRYLDLDSYGVQVQMTSARTRFARFSTGLDLGRDVPGGTNERTRTYYDEVGTVVGSIGKRLTASVPTGRFDNYAGFLQGTFYLSPQWSLDAGGRYTHYRYRTDYTAKQAGFAFEPTHRDDDAVCGSLGLVFAPIEDLHLSANVATGYREPNAQDLYFSGPGSVGFVVGNPDLKPEKSVSYDLGAKWGPGDLAFSVNGFYSTFDGLIDAVFVPDSPPEAQGQPTYQYTNITRARMYGFELEGEGRWREWSARTALAFTRGDVTSARAIEEIYGVSAHQVPLDMVPPLGGSTSLRWTEPAKRFWAQAAARYSAAYQRIPPEIPGVGAFSTPKASWMVGDLSLGASLATGQRCVLGVRNVLDTRYRQAIASVVDPGRTFFASLSSDF